MKFWEIAAATKVVLFDTKCVSTVRFLTSANEVVAVCPFHGGIMVGSCSDHGRIVLLLAVAFDGLFVRILNLLF